MNLWRRLAQCCLFLLVAAGLSAHAADKSADYRLGPGDVVRVNVFQNPDLTTETRVSESGTITFPLIGEVPAAGLSISALEQRIAQRLKEGGFVLQPQVNALILQFRSLQVSVLGQVNRPGRYPFEAAANKLTDAIALAGGVTQTGSDTVIVVRLRDGKEQKFEVDLPAMLQSADTTKDFNVMNGDVIFVPRAPVFYVYGEVQRPGQYRVERDMTVMQAIAVGGGVTLRGTEKRLRLTRRDGGGEHVTVNPQLNDPVRPDDVVYVRESFF